MTTPDTTISAGSAAPVEPATPSSAAPAAFWRRLRVIGTGFGISVTGGDLEAVVIRSRPVGSDAVASTVVRNFAARPAAEWGAELSAFLAAAGEPRLAATLVLPRGQVIVRTLHLAGVAEKDTAAAIELQLDTLHPWDDEPVNWAWWRVAPADVVVGIVRQSTLEQYETLFAEAGIPMAAATFSSAVIHAALRLQSAAPASVFCYVASGAGANAGLEVYGESPARPCYSAEFSMAAGRALTLARAELRLPPEQAAVELEKLLPVRPRTDGAVSAIACAAALASSAPLAVRIANLLPAERRSSHSRTRFLVPVALGTLVVAGFLGVFVLFPLVNEHRFVNDLTAEQRRLQPAALRAQAIDKALATHRARIAALDDFRRRPQADLDVLNELVRLLPNTVWTSSIEIFPDSVVIAGEADQAAPLLKLLDSSPLFQNSEFVMSVTHNGQADQFRIKTVRRGRAGRSTP